MSDSDNTISLSIRERGWLDTDAFETGQPTLPGKVITISVNPMNAFLGLSTVEYGSKHYASTAAMLLSRFKRFRYVGSKISLVPAATQAALDPAHINETAGVQNAMNPKDVSNMIHWSRWLGAPRSLPYVSGTGSAVGTPPLPSYTLKDSYDLDAAWSSMDDFQHVPVTEGFSVVVKPLVTTATLGSSVVSSVFGFKDSASLGYDPAGVDSRVGLRPDVSELRAEGWLPNPLAGLKFSTDEASYPGKERCYVSGINLSYPWYADDSNPSALTAENILTLIRKRYVYPALILRIPPAYGSKFYWSIYLRHLIEFSDPYLISSQYMTGSMTPYVPGPNIADGDVKYVAKFSDDSNSEEAQKYRLVTLTQPDPFFLTGNSGRLDFDGLNATTDVVGSDPFSERVDSLFDSVLCRGISGDPAMKSTSQDKSVKVVSDDLQESEDEHDRA